MSGGSPPTRRRCSSGFLRQPATTSRSSPLRRPPAFVGASPPGRPFPAPGQQQRVRRRRHRQPCPARPRGRADRGGSGDGRSPGRAATGQADDLLTNTLLMAGDGPVLMAPATTRNVAVPGDPGLCRDPAQLGVTVLEPASPADRRRLGAGSVAEPDVILTAARASLVRLLLRQPRPRPQRTRSRGPVRIRPTPCLPPSGRGRVHRDHQCRLAPGDRWHPRAFLATAPPASRAWPWLLPPSRLVPWSSCWPPTWRSRPCWCSICPGGDGPTCGKAALHAAADSDVVIMAAAVADFSPRGRLRHEDQEARRRRGPRDQPGAQPRTSCGSSSRSAMPFLNQLIVGFAAETGERRR